MSNKRIFVSWTVKGIGAAATLASLLGYIALRPSISIEPYASLDSNIPFGQQFSVLNSSAYTIRKVRFTCGFGSNKGFALSQLSVSNPFQDAGNIAPDTKAGFDCELGAGPTSARIAMTASVDYDFPLGFHGCKSQSFEGQRAAGGAYIWTYTTSRGDSRC